MAQELDANSCVALHSAVIYDRGGRHSMFPLLQPQIVRWGRIRDDTSEATVVLAGENCRTSAVDLAKIEPHRHELVLFRGGERVWEGPINRVAWKSSTVEITAHDVTDYLLGTPMSHDYDNRGSKATEVSTRIEGIIRNEMVIWETLDPPANVLPYLDVHHYPYEARTAMHTIPFATTVGQHLDDLARDRGIDYTAIGRAIHIWDTSRALTTLRTLTERDFYGDVVITAYGSDHTEIAYVVAEDGRFGVAGEASGYYGPWTKIFTVYNEEGTDGPTQTELDSQAARNIAGRTPVPVQVRVPDNSSIRLSYNLGINDLIPGAQMQLSATLNARQMMQLQKLDMLRVEETALGENIQVTLSPANSPDPDGPPAP